MTKLKLIKQGTPALPKCECWITRQYRILEYNSPVTGWINCDNFDKEKDYIDTVYKHFEKRIICMGCSALYEIKW